jgi:hypothetical protein
MIKTATAKEVAPAKGAAAINEEKVTQPQMASVVKG